MKSPASARQSFLFQTIPHTVFGTVLMHTALRPSRVRKQTFCHDTFEFRCFGELSYITSLHSFSVLLIVPFALPHAAAVNRHPFVHLLRLILRASPVPRQTRSLPTVVRAK